MNEPSATALLVEDEPQIRRFVRAALEEEGCRSSRRPPCSAA